MRCAGRSVVPQEALFVLPFQHAAPPRFSGAGRLLPVRAERAEDHAGAERRRRSRFARRVPPSSTSCIGRSRACWRRRRGALSHRSASGENRMSTVSPRPMTLWSVDFPDLYARHLCRHSQLGINVIHLIALFGVWFGVYATVHWLTDAWWLPIAAGGGLSRPGGAQRPAARHPGNRGLSRRLHRRGAIRAGESALVDAVRVSRDDPGSAINCRISATRSTRAKPT